jgi:hypothetical protein
VGDPVAAGDLVLARMDDARLMQSGKAPPESDWLTLRAREVSVALRTAHLVSFGLLLGGHAFAIEAGRLLPALYVTVGSGLGLMALELRLNGLHWLFLGKGATVLVKLALLLAVLPLWEHRVFILVLVVVIASVGAHMPSRYRHYSLLHRRVVQSGERLPVWNGSAR